MVKRQKLRFNYENQINYSELITDYNNYCIEHILIFGRVANSIHINSGLFNFTEHDVSKYFFAQDHDILNLIGLLPIFILYGLGIIISFIVFCVEFLYFQYKKWFLIAFQTP